MSRRGRVSTPISLFSFQDIITSVTGILILLMLMLAVELVTRKPAASAPVSDASESLASRAAIEAAEQEIAELRLKLEESRGDVAEIAGVTDASLTRESDEVANQVRRLELELRQLESQASAADSKRDQAKTASSARNDDRVKLAALEAEASGAEAALAELAASNRVIYNPSAGGAKTAWLVDVSADRLLIARADDTAATRTIALPPGDNRVAAFKRWAADRDMSHEYFVLLVRPSGVVGFEALQQAIERLGFDLGFDVISESATVLGPMEEPGR